MLCLFAVAFLAGGGWALWKDRISRDSQGFVSFGTSDLTTETYAIVGDLKGDGPDWLYGSTVFGDERVRATSQTGAPLFVGIARKNDVMRYLDGAGYAKVEGFEVSADTTHQGGPPAGAPGRETFWAASTLGTGQQTLVWSPRDGDWSVVLMNANASANVDVHGDASAELPILPWVAGGLLLVAGVFGFFGVRVLVHARRRPTTPTTAATTPTTPTPPKTPVIDVADAERQEQTMDGYRDLLERYVELYNAGDLDGVMALYADDAVQWMPDGLYEGREQIRARLQRELAAFPDLHWELGGFVEQGDAFADEWWFVGTHTGPLSLPDGSELRPTGKRVVVKGMEYVQMRDGKIVVDNLYYDNLAVATQLGLLPADAPTSV